jgi:hypothetical protein
MKLVDDAGKAWKWFSMHAMVAGTALQGAWLALPDDMKASIPPQYVTWATFALFVLGIAGRLVKQEPK